jgi:hypothetical protein
LVIMVCSADPTRCIQPEPDVAGPAEGLRIMAGAAVAHSAVGLRPMGCQEVQGMESRRVLAFMTAVAGALRVAGGALGQPGRSSSSVVYLEIPLMERRGPTLGKLDSSWPGLLGEWDVQYGLRKVRCSSMAGEATGPVMANRAVGGGCYRHGSVGGAETVGPVRSRRGKPSAWGAWQLRQVDGLGSLISERSSPPSGM